MLTPDVSMRNAILDLQRGRYRESIGTFQMVFGNDRAPARMRSDALSNAAVCHLRLRDWASAESCARSAVEIDPSHVDAWFNLGGSLKELRRPLDALHAFRKVCELRPDRADAWRYRAATAQGLFLWDEAADAWSMALAKGWDPRAFKGRVESLVLGGKAPLVDAETALFLAKNPENDLARYLRILVLADLQRFDEAVLLTNNLRDSLDGILLPQYLTERNFVRSAISHHRPVWLENQLDTDALAWRAMCDLVLNAVPVPAEDATSVFLLENIRIAERGDWMGFA